MLIHHDHANPDNSKEKLKMVTLLLLGLLKADAEGLKRRGIKVLWLDSSNCGAYLNGSILGTV